MFQVKAFVNSALMMALFSFPGLRSWGQDTFSIVAVDPATGQVGSAGATCLDDSDIAGGAIIISDVVPDHGAVHTQSYWVPANQNNAHQQFLSGLSPAELMTWLEENDVQNNPAIRQYGAVDLITGVARSAAFTGDDCMDVHGHITGDGYAIQGNILLDETILPAMESGFLEPAATLAEQLMAALQGANVPGADSRCLKEGVSSRSAFIRVAYPGDDPNNLTLDLNVSITPEGVEPIDALQELFNAWQASGQAGVEPMMTELNVYQDATGEVRFEWQNNRSKERALQIHLTSMTGQKGIFSVANWIVEPGELVMGVIAMKGFAPGTYIANLTSESGSLLGTKKFIFR